MVDHINAVNGLGGMRPTRRTNTAYRMSDAPIQKDSVELRSDVMRLNGLEGVRLDRVLAIKSQIEAGTYFTGDKLDKAMDNALDDVLGQLFV